MLDFFNSQDLRAGNMADTIDKGGCHRISYPRGIDPLPDILGGSKDFHEVALNRSVACKIQR